MVAVPVCPLLSVAVSMKVYEPGVVGVKLAVVLLLGLVIATVALEGPDTNFQAYDVMLRPVPATALPESVTAVPEGTDVGMLPKVTTGLATEGAALTMIVAVAVPACAPLSVAVNLKV